MHRCRSVRRHGQLREYACAFRLALVFKVVQVGVTVVEVHAAADEPIFVPPGEVGVGAHGYVGCLAFEDQLSFFQRLSPVPQLDDARVAGIRHRAGAEIGGDEQAVLPRPIDVALGFGEGEAAILRRYESLRLQVELAGDRGIRAAPGKAHQTAVVIRLAADKAVQHPVLAFAAGQAIQIEHRLPVRFVAAVLLQRSAPPQATRIVLVAPEVVVVAAVLRDGGDAVV